MNIVIVEPSKTWQSLIENSIQAQDVNIRHTSGIASAIAAITSSIKIDIIIASSVLVDGTAFDLVTKLRSVEKARFTPLFLLTSNDEVEKYKDAFDQGVTEIYSKGDPNIFFESIKNRISKTRSKRKLDGHILHIEDSEEDAFLVRTILEDNNFSVDRFRSAEEAIGSVSSEDYDLIISDFFLDGKMTALSLLKKMQSGEASISDLPFMVVSSDANTSRRIELFVEGASDYISKPIIAEEFITRVTNLITNKKLVDELDAQREQMEMRAMTDQLTGLYNRNFLIDQGYRKIAEAQRHSWDCAFMVIDVDKFKSINDNYGHSTGDEVLTSVAECLNAQFRKEDIVARYGGEEFVVIAPHCNYDQAMDKANSVRKAIQALNPLDLEVTASFGVTTVGLFRDQSPTFDQLFTIADKCVYKAKDDGRNIVVGSLQSQ